MDGRRFFRVKFSCVSFVAGLLLAIASPSLYGQAMGKAVVDAGSMRPAAHAPESITVAPPEPARTVLPPLVASVDPALQVPVMTTEVVKPAAPAVAPAAALAKPEPVSAPVAAKPATTAEGTHSDAGTSTTNDIEQSPIRRSASNANTATKNAETPAAGKSSLIPTGLGNFGQVAAALAIVIGLIFIGRGLVRKFVPGAGAASGKGVIEILARHPLTKNQSIVLVRIGSQIVALNQGRESSESVLVINDAAEVARIIGQIDGKNPNSISAGFNNLLSNARMDLEENGDADAAGKSIDPEGLDEQLEEMAAAKRQLMELRQHVRSVRDRMPSA